MKRYLLRTNPLALTWLFLIGLAAALTPASPPPDLLNTLVAPFHAPHWLGTDSVGHDVWSSLLAGARSALQISLPAALLANLLGGLLGVLSGFFGNKNLRIPAGWLIAGVVTMLVLGLLLGPVWPHWRLLGLCTMGIAGISGWLLARFHWGSQLLSIPLDDMVQALIALLDSIPLLVLILTVAAIEQPSPLGLIVLLTVTCWTTPARLLRAATLRTVSLPFVLAAEATGIPPLQIVYRHIWPSVWPVLLVRIPLSIALIIGLETTLSFLGVGLPPEVASWGRLLASSRLAPTAWWLIACPGITLFLTIWSLQSLAQATFQAPKAAFDVTK